MIDYAQLQEILKEHLEQDRAIRSVDATGPTLEAAVNEAAALLDTSIRRLEYEIIERGSSGFMGAGKKDWLIRAYETVRVKKGKKATALDEDEFDASAPVIVNKDGEAFAQCRNDGVYLKVTPPSGSGKKAQELQAIQALGAKEAKNIDIDMVEKVLNAADGIYVKVADFDYNPVNNSMAVVDVDDSEMHVTVEVTPPGPGGCDLTFDD